VTVVYSGKNYSDEGLEWGRAWYLQLASPEIQWGSLHNAACVVLVRVARRRCGGTRKDGYRYRYFVRFAGVEYGSNEYFTVLDMEPPYGKTLFLSEAEAWESYAQWLERYIARHREFIDTAEQMLTEARGMARLKAEP